MKHRLSGWVLVADGCRARLLRGEFSPGGSLRFVEVDRLENEWEEREHGRPSPRAGREGHSYASLRHEREESLRRYTRDLLRWVDRSLARRQVGRVLAFVPARLAGALRKSVSPSMNRRLATEVADLGYLTPGALARHPVVRSLIAPDLAG